MENTPAPKFSEDFISRVVNLISTQYPFDFSGYKLPTIARRIARRMLKHNIEEEDRFLSFLQENPTALELLINDFLIGVTAFYRDAEAFHILETKVIPNLFKHHQGDFVKIWVACCATGEEAYSLAILIKEHLETIRSEVEVKIFATDINQSALRIASAGVFTPSNVKTLSAPRLQKYFDQFEHNYKIKPEIRKMLIFARHDLTTNPPFCDVDLISCRNMLIYIKAATQKQILSKLGFGLKKGGYLFLGASENLSLVKEDYLEISSKWKIYQRTKSERRLPLDAPLLAPLSDLPLREQVEKAPEIPASVKYASSNLDMTTAILTESSFCGVSIDIHGKVLKAFGNLSPFLKPERFNFNLKDLLPDTLAVAFSTSFLKVLKTNERVRINNIKFIEPASFRRNITDLALIPYREGKSKVQVIMVLFKITDDALAIHKLEDGQDFEVDKHTGEHIAQLEEEVYQSRQDLLFATERLENAREAMQAYNEELLSANEEMQSANEELQSINEELETLNADYKYTIEELSNLNDDLNNYFRSNINGQLFVDKDILLKKYSPGAVKHININETDIGRPLSNITTNIKFDTLIEDIKKVIETREVIIQEIEDAEARIYQVITSPFLRKIDNQVYGAIITFYDISELKKAQYDLDKTNRMLVLATDSAEIGTWSINVNTRQLICSPRLKGFFGFPADDEMSISHAVSQISKEYQTSFLNTINESINKGAKFETEFPVHGLLDEKHRWIRAIGNVTYSKDGNAEFLTGIMQDVTDHKLDDLRKNDFIAIVSHELKTPLTSLSAYIQILIPPAIKTGNTFTASFLDKASNQIKRMTALINGFLNVSRLESGKIHLNRYVFEMDVLIQQIIDEVLTTDSHKVVFSPECSVSVNADREKIGQVINNILSNAIKYSPRNKTIMIHCTKTSGNVQVNIKDEGPGIKPADQERLFDRYFRVEREDMEMISGFGLGLYLASEIIQRHGGKIWIESEPGRGSTFCFSIPCDQNGVSTSMK